MKLVNRVSWNFPGPETQANIEEHLQTVLKFMQKKQALCIKCKDEIAGVILFSRHHNMICCLAVAPEYRHRGIGSALLEKALSELDRSKDITISTFRENDEKEVFLTLYWRNDHGIISWRKQKNIMVVCNHNKINGGSYRGIPKFIAETLSPSTAMRDLSVKKDIYETAGVSEYWIVSPRERGVQIYYLDFNSGKYALANSYILEDDPDNEYYNADIIISLREFPHIHMTLADIFENVS